MAEAQIGVLELVKFGQIMQTRREEAEVTSSQSELATRSPRGKALGQDHIATPHGLNQTPILA
jgi:hypothetical protein